MQATSSGGLARDFTIEEVAEAMNMSVRWVRERVADGSLPHYRAGHKLRFTAEHVNALRKSLEVVPITQGITATRRRRAS